MPNSLTKIFLSLLWAGIGVLGAWLSFWLLSKQAEAIRPESAGSFKPLIRMMVGRFVRLAVVAMVIYLALRMDALYALIFVISLTIATLIMAVALNKKTNKSKVDTESDQRR